MEMNGFVRSRRPAGVYCMKRHINPGQKVSLDELYEQYGVSNDLTTGPEFIKWLRTVKLKRRDIWEIMYNDKPIVSGEEPFEELARQERERKEEPEIKEPEKKLAGKIHLEGEIKVDGSDEMAFSFPSKKEDAPVKSGESVNDRSKFTKIRSTGGSIKAVRARNDGSEKPTITPQDILELKVNELDKIDKVQDIKILTITLKSAEDMRNKATLCKRLKSRISRLKPRSRFGSV